MEFRQRKAVDKDAKTLSTLVLSTAPEAYSYMFLSSEKALYCIEACVKSPNNPFSKEFVRVLVDENDNILSFVATYPTKNEKKLWDNTEKPVKETLGLSGLLTYAKRGKELESIAARFSGDSLYILHLATIPAARKHGLGTYLLDYEIECAKKMAMVKCT